MKTFSGTMTALITPFFNGEVDFDSLEKLVANQIKRKVSGFVISGTTGESPTLTSLEKFKIYDFIRAKVPKNFPLILGVGGNSTARSIEEAKEAEKMGADAVLSIVPYYNKPPQRGLFEHFKEIASAIHVPCILYNVPSRTITSLELQTIKRLSEHPNIIGIKEASGNIEFAKQIRKECGESFILLSGDDASYDQFMEAGGNGAISVASHLIPEAFAQRNVSDFKNLVNYLFIEANPIPLKMALYLLQIIRSPELRLPLVKLGEAHTNTLKILLMEKGLLS